MGFLKVLKQPVQNIENIWKYDFKWTRYLIAIFIVSFDLYQYVLATSLEKWKTNFPRMYFWSTLCCHYKISNILLNHQTFLTRNSEISVRWFLLKSMLKQKWAQGWQGKRKQMGSILLRYQPSVTCNFRTTLKSIFDFTEIVNAWKWKASDLFLNCHRSDTYKLENVFTVSSYAVWLAITRKTMRWKTFWPKIFG